MLLLLLLLLLMLLMLLLLLLLLLLRIKYISMTTGLDTFSSALSSFLSESAYNSSTPERFWELLDEAAAELGTLEKGRSVPR